MTSNLSKRNGLLPMLGMLILVAAGCEASVPETLNTVSAPSNEPATIQTQQATPPSGLKGKVKFKDGDGITRFSVKPMDDGAKIVDAEEKELARLNVKSTKMKIKDPNDNVLGYVVGSQGRYKIKNPDQSKDLWKLQRQDDGDWKLEDGNDSLMYKIKKRDYGFEIESASEKSLFKVKLKDGKTSLRNSSDATVYYTKDSVLTGSVACLGFEAIKSREIRVALMTMICIVEK